MRRLRPLSIVCLCICPYVFSQENHTFNLMPVPQQLSTGDGELKLDRSFALEVHAARSDAILWSAVDRSLQSLKKTTGLPLEQKTATPTATTASAEFKIIAHERSKFEVGADESYTLTVTSTSVVLEANDGMGVVRGLQTFAQLIQRKGQSFYLPVVTIHDTPRYAWRGLMIDSARHFMPVEVIKRNIDAMEMVKLNVLHLHLSDNEGFRVESKVLSKLQLSGSDGQFYTQAEIRELIAYARVRGVVIVPEFDTPSHSSSWVAGYPELGTPMLPPPAAAPATAGPAARGPMSIPDVMAAFKAAPLPAMDPTKESTYKLIDLLIGEMSQLFTGPYFHIGADENNGVVWRGDPAIVAYMKAHHISDTDHLQAYFVNRVREIVVKNGKHTVAWAEAYAPELSDKAIFQAWNPLADSDLLKTAAKGTPILVSSGFYLDLMLPAHAYYLNDIFLKNPATQGSVMGGEAAMWSELEDQWNVESRIWPRAGAIAERLWSPASVQDVDDMYRRLFHLSFALDQAGVNNLVDYNRHIRRLSGDLSPEPVKTLLDVLMTSNGLSRLMGNLALSPAEKNPLAPLNRVSDVVLVDSLAKHRFREALADYLQTQSLESEAKLRSWLSLWAANDVLLQPYVTQSRELEQVAPQSQSLTVLAKVGLGVLNGSRNGQTLTAEQVAQDEALLKGAKNSAGGTEISIFPEIDALVHGKLTPEPSTYPLF